MTRPPFPNTRATSSGSGHPPLWGALVAKGRGRLRAAIVSCFVVGAVLESGCTDTFEVKDPRAPSGGMGAMPSSSGGTPSSGGALLAEETGGSSQEGPSTGGQPVDEPASGGQGGADPVGPTIICDDSEMWCEEQCIHPDTDPVYCGADCQQGNLGEVCEVDEACVDGVCELQCDPGRLNCFGTCIDPLRDKLYCGAQGMCSADEEQGDYCEGEEHCIAGRCVGWGSILEEAEGSAPYSSAVRADGLVIWAMRRDDSWSFRILSEDAKDFSKWGPSTVPAPDFIHAQFTDDGVAAFGMSGKGSLQIGFFDVDNEVSGPLSGTVAQWIPRQLVVDHGGDSVVYVGDDNASLDPQLVGFSLSYPSGDALSIRIAESADNPGSSASVRGLLATAWREPTESVVRLRFLNPDQSCCESEVVSSSELQMSGQPQLSMDADQNVAAVWPERIGPLWYLQTLTVKSSDAELAAWNGTARALATSVSSSEPQFVFRGTLHGGAVIVFIQEDDAGNRLAFRFYDPQEDAWSEVDFVEDALPGLSAATPGHRFLDVSMNDAGFANIVWVDKQGQIWSSSHFPGESGFGKGYLVASAKDVKGVETQIDAQGRVFVFWDDDAGSVFARWMKE